VTLDGAGIPQAKGRGAVPIAHGRAMPIADCEIVASGGHGIRLEATEASLTRP
jgi:hypothetical protein